MVVVMPLVITQLVVHCAGMADGGECADGATGNTPSNIGSDRVTLRMRSKVSEDMSDDMSSVPTSLHAVIQCVVEKGL